MVPSIRFDDVSKRYRLTGARYRSLREEISRAARRLNPFLHSAANGACELWALRNLSLEIGPGQALGVIGPNGAGKSTLLKLIAGITLPTRGRIELRGRVASLIEVSAGIHPELTGRENIFLSGTVMGMSRAEVATKFDQIVEFAGLADFIDVPVKRYSSGMFIRLGFAVAAHLDPDILLVDEVLSVGDLAFQRKSSERMRQLLQGGRTVLLVSHNLPVVESACQQALLLVRGEGVALGPARDIIRRYTSMQDSASSGAGTRWIRGNGQADSPLRILEVTIGGKAFAGDPLLVTWGESLQVEIHYKTEPSARVEDAYIAVAFWRGDGLRVIYETTEGRPSALSSRETSSVLTFTIPAWLVPALYGINVAVHDRVTRAVWDSLSNILIRVDPPLGGRVGQWDSARSVLAPPVGWQDRPAS